MAEKYKVRNVERARPKGEFLVYAWIGHPLLGKVRGTERVFRGRGAKSRATEYAKALRKLAKE